MTDKFEDQYYRNFQMLNKILSVIHTVPSNLQTLADMVGRSKHSVRFYVLKLVEEGLAERTGKLGATIYYQSKITEMSYDDFKKLYDYEKTIEMRKNAFKERTIKNMEKQSEIIKGARVFTLESLHEKHLEQSQLNRKANAKKRYNTNIGSSFNLV